MTPTPRRTRGRFEATLDPASSLVEVLVAIVIALGVISAARIGAFGDIAPGETIAVVLACAVAWGAIDGGLYLVATKMDNGRLDRLGLELRQQPELTDEERRSKVAEVFDGVAAAGPAELVAPAYDHLAAAMSVARPPRRLSRDDVRGALLIVGWVLLVTAIVVIPLTLPLPPAVAYTSALVVGMVLLFVAGRVWARHTLYRPFRVGLGLAAIGGVMIVLTIALGAV